MSTSLRPKAQDLAKAWTLSRSSDLRQMTVRVPAETFYKIQALEAMFPGRSRNEMVSDLLFTALAEFVDGLPSFGVLDDGTRVDLSRPDAEHLDIHHVEGPREDFWQFVKAARIKAESSSDKGQDEDKGSKPALKLMQDGEAA